MPEHDALVRSYVHLANFPRANEALHTLRKVASLVKPLMRARGWKVGELAEFYPNQTNLLGLNVDRGRKICIRLRYPGDRNQFMPTENVVDTMLHELCHNVHGPHNEAFHKLWNELRDEQQDLLMKGYTGEGFLSDGKRLGGSRVPPMEAHRLAREAAEKRQRMPTGTAGGRRLGGTAPRPGQDIRRVIMDAVQRRNETLKGCATEKLSDRQIRDLADTATRSGFRTQAEEDRANEVAIAQALSELAQEVEADHGPGYTQAYANQSTGQGSKTTEPSPRHNDDERQSQGGSSSAEQDSRGWTCGACTLHNPLNFLCCDACGAERPEGTFGKVTETAASLRSKPSTNRQPETIDLTSSPPQKRDQKRRRVDTTSHRTNTNLTIVPETWLCSFCGQEMAKQWWTCSVCGRMKDSS